MIKVDSILEERSITVLLDQDDLLVKANTSVPLNSYYVIIDFNEKYVLACDFITIKMSNDEFKKYVKYVNYDYGNMSYMTANEKNEFFKKYMAELLI